MCARLVGDQSRACLLHESGTYGNTSGAGVWLGLVTEHNISTSTNVESLRYVGTGSRSVSLHVDGPLDVEGTLTFHPQDWRLMGFFLGSIVDGGSPSPYTHVMSETNNNVGNAFTSGAFLPFLSFSVEDTQVHSTGSNFKRTVNGAIVNTWEFSVSEGEIAEISVDYIAKDVVFASGAATSVTPSTVRPFQWNDIRVHIPSGTVFEECKGVTVTCENNLEANHYMNGSRVVVAPLPQNRDYNLSIELHGTSQNTKSLWDQYFVGGSEFNVMIEHNDKGAGAGSRDAFLIFSGCKLIEMEAPTTNEGPQEQAITVVPKTCIVNVDDLIQNYNVTL